MTAVEGHNRHSAKLLHIGQTLPTTIEHIILVLTRTLCVTSLNLLIQQSWEMRSTVSVHHLSYFKSPRPMILITDTAVKLKDMAHTFDMECEHI